MRDATRTAALSRLHGFLPRAGLAYARDRNRDLPGHHAVSGLSPYIRHRLLLEEEVAEAALVTHGAQDAEKFLSEVYWRTYWKGWLELRPRIWSDYRQGLQAALNRVATEAGLRKEWEAACEGRTGIDAFDHWANELVTAGYLHNHARMWFASIWIFTLRLPWELGADFFLRHLLDGDPASNTLSWRWVGGLHTPGKTYLATAENIAKNTNRRFAPEGLACAPFPLRAPAPPAPGSAPTGDDWGRAPKVALLMHEDDLDARWLLDRITPIATALAAHPAGRSSLTVAPMVTDFTTAALQDAASRLPPSHRFVDGDIVGDLTKWARASGATEIISPYAPTGPMADTLRDLARALAPYGITVARALRPYDAALWPHATHGFFRFREAIGSTGFNGRSSLPSVALR
ncbi:MAG: DNA photolyase [Rhodobacteraceae bacterium]|nr:DNA photolyase [Paracoccaceae bacterium]